LKLRRVSILKISYLIYIFLDNIEGAQEITLTSEEIYDKIVFKEINTLIEESRKSNLLLAEVPIIDFGGGKCKAFE